MRLRLSEFRSFPRKRGSKFSSCIPITGSLNGGAPDELTTDPSVTTESIAKREDCSIRKVNMTISLAFLAPDLVKAAIDGRLPHGVGVARLTDLPPEWSRQHELLHLPSH
jgi:hypothetical protein